MTPRDTFNTFVRPAAADCQTDPGAPHRAVSALCHIDALAEEVWHVTNKPEGSVRRYRSSLQQKCVELGHAWLCGSGKYFRAMSSKMMFSRWASQTWF
jgi:hypothetical protein